MSWRFSGKPLSAMSAPIWRDVIVDQTTLIGVTPSGAPRME